MNNPRCVLISDIHGDFNVPWMDEYRQVLLSHVNLIEYDCRELAGINLELNSDVHKQLVNGGIDSAVRKLQELEKESFTIIGFSIGGTIAWKFALESENVVSLHLVSATRLRLETKSPTAQLSLYYADREIHGPNQAWHDRLGLISHRFVDAEHECYKNSKFIQLICSKIVKEIHI